jgi:hypothetical protein
VQHLQRLRRRNIPVLLLRDREGLPNTSPNPRVLGDHDSAVVIALNQSCASTDQVSTKCKAPV